MSRDQKIREKKKVSEWEKCQGKKCRHRENEYKDVITRKQPFLSGTKNGEKYLKD